jgi:hypothetical protein
MEVGHSGNKNNGASFAHLCNRVSFAAFSSEKTRARFHKQKKGMHGMSVIAREKVRQSVSNTHDISEPLGLAEIHRFCSQLQEDAGYMQGKVMLTWAGAKIDITDGAMLVGSFCIMLHEKTPDEMRQAFQPISHHIVGYMDDLTVMDCWSALYHAKAICGWLDFKSDFWLRLHRRWSYQRESLSEHDVGQSDQTINMEEYAHYDNPANGHLHFVIPDKLIIFDCPDNLPGGAIWADVDGQRRFSAVYYADLFSHLSVDVVVCCGGYGDGEGNNEAAFTDLGIEVENLDVDSAGSLLGAIDRFQSLARHVPGAIALHGGPEGLGILGSLVAVHLMSRHGFRAREAVAWVGMVHPVALPAAQQAVLATEEGRMVSIWHSEPSLVTLVSAADSEGDGGGSGDPLQDASSLAAPPSVLLLLRRSVSLSDLVTSESEQHLIFSTSFAGSH